MLKALRFLINYCVYLLLHIVVFLGLLYCYFNSIFSCPGHRLITALADGFTTVKYVIIIITIIIIMFEIFSLVCISWNHDFTNKPRTGLILC